MGVGTPLISKVASATVNGLNGLEIGTLMLKGLNPMLVRGILNGSGTNGTAARDESKNERTYLKSANTVRYLSHRSRVNEPSKAWRSAGGSAGAKALKFKTK